MQIFDNSNNADNNSRQPAHTHNKNNNDNSRSNSRNNHKMLDAYSSKLKLKLKLKRISRHLASLQVALGDGQAQTSPKAFPEFQLLVPFCLCPYHCCCVRFRLPLVLVLDCLCLCFCLPAWPHWPQQLRQYPCVSSILLLGSSVDSGSWHRLIPNGKCCLGKSTRSGRLTN